MDKGGEGRACVLYHRLLAGVAEIGCWLWWRLASVRDARYTTV